MAQTTILAGKILPRNSICCPARTFLLACTEEEFGKLILGRLKSTLEKYGASYFTIDDFMFTLYQLAGSSLALRPSLLEKLEKEGKITIVPFSPGNIYRIVDEPSPNPQTRS